MIFDTHVHYDDDAFNADREELLSGLSSRNIGHVVNIGVDIATSKMTLELAENYDNIYAAIGFHPSETKAMSESDIDWLRAHCYADPEEAQSRYATAQEVGSELPRNQKVVAIGEIGLDYHWSESEEENQNQQHWFRRQIAMAKEVGLPIVVHSREAAADTMSIIREENAADCGGIIHCYSYSAEQAKEYVAMGFYIGVGGVVTFKNARRLIETVEAIPLTSIVLETDCPYMAPEPYRGKRNDSTLLPYVVKKIAELKNISEEEVVATTERNAIKVYNINHK
ncbi:MAG: TatD family hydrolase [Eubacterium sp.]|nr:TatD family hydrolase [Eubacterium sp.]